MLELAAPRAAAPAKRPAGGRQRRRTQKERSAETRALLLDVTVECLADLGYTGTTSKVVAERAGLSRGAQLHHFGTKAQLVTAALEHLFARRLDEFQRGFAARRPGSDPVRTAIDLLWGILCGTSGHAYLELVCAARTDHDLRDAIVALNEKMDERVDATFRSLFSGTPGSDELFDVAWTGLFALLEGLAFEKIIRKDDRRIDRVVEILLRFAPLLVTPRPAAAE